MLKSSLLVVGLNSSTLAVAMLSRWLLPISPTPNSPKPISPKPISPKIVFRSFQPFLGGVRLRRHRRVFAPLKTFSDPLTELENSNRKRSYCNICIRYFRKLYVFLPLTLIFDLFPSEFVFDVTGAFLRLIKTFPEPLTKLKNSKRKWSFHHICIGF